MGYYTVVRVKELDLHVAMWVKPEITMLGEKSKEHYIFLYNFKHKLIIHITGHLSDIKLSKCGLRTHTSFRTVTEG